MGAGLLRRSAPRNDVAMDIGTTSADERQRPWRDELRSTLSLAWPLILANLTQQLIQATDILLFGRLRAAQLPAAPPGLNPPLALSLFFLRVVPPPPPLVATA